MSTLLRRVCAGLLCALLSLPAVAAAKERPPSSSKKRKAAEERARRVAPDDERPTRDQEEDEDGSSQASVSKGDAPAPEEPLANLFKLPQLDFSSKHHRYAFVGGGILILGGMAFAFSAQGEAKRAETISNAREAQKTLVGAQQSAATANLFYGLAAVTLTYALLMEVLPTAAPDQAPLTFHF